MQSNYRELITGISLTPSQPARSVPCLSPTRSFSPIKQYLYANHPGLIATALHARVIRVTIMVSRSPIVSFATAGTYPRRFPCATVRGIQWRFIRRIPGDCTAALLTKHSYYPLIRIPGFFRNASRRYYYCHYASSEIRHAHCSAHEDLISREKRVGQVELILCGIYRNAEQFRMKKSNNFLRKAYTIKIRDRGS